MNFGSFVTSFSVFDFNYLSKLFQNVLDIFVSFVKRDGLGALLFKGRVFFCSVFQKKKQDSEDCHLWQLH